MQKKKIHFFLSMVVVDVFLQIKLENGENLDGSEPNDVASLLKQWLRELPEPLIPNYMHDLYIR